MIIDLDAQTILDVVLLTAVTTEITQGEASQGSFDDTHDETFE